MPNERGFDMTFAVPAGPPDPARAHSLDDLVGCLRGLKTWAGDPSFDTITRRINTRWRAAGRRADELARRGTVVDCFKTGRRRINAELVVAVVQALHDYPDYLARWRQALRDGRVGTEAAARVRVYDRLPDDGPGFVGRCAELAAIGEPLTVLTGMPGAGKTALAVHAAHRLAAAGDFGVVLVAGLRGRHPALPPVEPAQLADELHRRAAGRRALVVLDDAASMEQVRPLLPATPGSVTLVTSRRRLDGPRVEVEPLPPADAERLLLRAAPGVPAGPDPAAYRRVAERCGHLPLALTAAAAELTARPGWTVTDHADRLDERRRRLELDGRVESALHPSYRALPGRAQALLRGLALHPGPHFGPEAAAALLATPADLERLAREHLIRPLAPGRYTLPDLVRVYAARRGHDEDRPADRTLARARLRAAVAP
ncbi:hypothetical protein [Dactylosporangium matsuzakiense]|nr:hypothetical protein [Dactylosporangium matsuzakiense]UWZ48706.1 hypothetical protein Dmats_21265 [Dactylosporangium matsuzakiense]